MKQYDIIVLSQCTNYHQWVPIQKTSEETWISTVNNNVKILSYYPSTDLERGTSLEKNGVLYYGIDEDECWENNIDPRNERFIKALEYVNLNYNFTYVYRTGPTSYIDVNKMHKVLMEQVPRKKQYCGAQNGRNKGFIKDYKFNGDHSYVGQEDEEMVYFVSGFNVILSKDTVEHLVQNSDEFLKYDAPEDVVTGWVLRDYIKFDDQFRPTTFVWMLDYCDNYNEGWLDDIINNSIIFNYKVGLQNPNCVHHIHDRIIENKIGQINK